MVNTKAKAGLRSSVILQNLDFCYFKDYCLSQNIFAKVQTQDSTAKISKLKEFRPKNSKPANRQTSAPTHINKPEKTSCQNKKKKYFVKKWNQKNFISIINNNAIKDEKQ